MNLRVTEIKRFMQNASSIKANNIIPVLQYIKISSQGKAIKTNLNAYIIADISYSGDDLLLHEDVLSAFLKDCKSDEFEVKVDGATVWLFEGKRKMKFQFADAEIYPKTPELDKGAVVRFEQETLKALGVAVKNIGNNTLRAFDMVMLVDDWVIGTDTFKFYCYKVKDLPEVLIPAAAVNSIHQFGGVNFYRQKKYDFYEIGSILYGFIQTEHTMPDVVRFIFKDFPKEYMDIDVEEFVNFCDTVIAASPSKVLDSSFKGNKLSFYDADNDISYESELEVTGKYQPDLTFDPRIFGSFLKSLPYDYVRVGASDVNKAALSVWNADDENFRGLIMGTIIP